MQKTNNKIALTKRQLYATKTGPGVLRGPIMPRIVQCDLKMSERKGFARNFLLLLARRRRIFGNNHLTGDENGRFSAEKYIPYWNFALGETQ